MDLNDRLTRMENELKILKNEVQAVLLDLRESYLNHENPFNAGASSSTNQPIVINQPSQNRPSPAAAEEQHAKTPSKEQKGEPSTEPKSENKEFKEQAGKTEPSYKQEESIASKETAREEVKRALRSEIEPEALRKPRETADNNGDKTDLVTIAGLTKWVGQSVKRLGRERSEAVLDIAEITGHMPLNIKQALIKLINLTSEGHSGEVTTRDYMMSLTELDNVMSRGSKPEATLLSIMLQEDEHR